MKLPSQKVPESHAQAMVSSSKWLKSWESLSSCLSEQNLALQSLILIYFDWIISSSTGFSVYLFGRAISACQFFRKGEGAKIWFYKPEWEKGCDMKGGTFKA